jgi:hypothetical protein
MTTKQKPAVPVIPVVVRVVQSVPLERVGDLLCSAFEGGSNYWYMIEKFIAPKALTVRLDAEQVYRHVDYPLNVGGALLVSDARVAGEEDKKTVRLNLKAIKRGLTVMASKYPHHWGNFMRENDDAETGDVFLQCCLFGELVYG